MYVYIYVGMRVNGCASVYLDLYISVSMCVCCVAMYVFIYLGLCVNVRL